MEVSTTDRRLLVSFADSQGVLGGVSRTTIYELAKAGELTKVSIGRRGFITAESLAAYVNRLSEAATA
jgi:excisionase family DNA binding protein